MIFLIIFFNFRLFVFFAGGPQDLDDDKMLKMTSEIDKMNVMQE